MFVDASAVVAILNGEAEAASFTDALERGAARITSPIAIFEATLGLCRVRHAAVEEAARTHDMPLLFRGNNFTKTDIEPAAAA